ncbi:MAG: 16S rRNA processing protein RimM [Candidatus Kapabacteria bacterium]|nr:16S rRNA processing protein RimM [Candidatus Kapabacteria bacterium]
MSHTETTEYLGVIGRPHGVDGTVVLIDTVGLPVRLDASSVVHVGYSRDFTKPHRVAAFQASPTRTTLRLADITSPEAATALVDQAVFVTGDTLAPSAKDRYRIGDIEGAVVIDEAGNTLGEISEVWLLPANDVWVLRRPDGTTIPLPVIDDVIRDVQIDERRVTVRLLEGLEDLDNASAEDRDA